MMEKNRTLTEAAQCLRQGGVVIYPTETFMAIGSQVSDKKAVRRVYEIKQRARSLPLPVIAGDMAQVRSIARIPPEAEELIRRFWPAPISVLLPALSSVPPDVSGGTGYVAVRISPHPGARALALAVGEPLVGSSANISGAKPAAAVVELDALLLKRVDGVWDQAPKPEGGLPSTLVRVTGPGKVQIVRSGAILADVLRGAGFQVG